MALETACRKNWLKKVSLTPKAETRKGEAAFSRSILEVTSLEMGRRRCEETWLLIF
jgi:hypothetical protein